MSYKIYVASGLENIARAKEIIARLRSEGFEITYDWTVHGRLYDQDALRNVAMLEESGVRNCDTILVVLPGSSGTHFEFGLARALDKKIILLEEVEVKQSSFYYLPGILKVKTEEDAVAMIHHLKDQPEGQ